MREVCSLVWLALVGASIGLMRTVTELRQRGLSCVISLLVGKRFLAASLLQSDFAGEVFGYGGITIGPADQRMLISCDRPTARSRHDAGPLRKKTAYAPPCRAQTWTLIGLIGNRQVTDSHIEISSSLRPLVSTAAIATVAPPTTPIAARNK
jgi:hypothetical protein